MKYQYPFPLVSQTKTTILMQFTMVPTSASAKQCGRVGRKVSSRLCASVAGNILSKTDPPPVPQKFGRTVR
jgi:hypothetical protein